MLPPDRDIVLVGDPATAVEAKIRLGRIGYDRVVGQLADPAALLAARPELHESSSRLTAGQLAELRRREPGLQVLDVRSPSETAHGTLPGARVIPFAALVASLADLDAAAAVVVYCASGYRSPVAASVLRGGRLRRRVRPARRLRRLGSGRTPGQRRRDADPGA